MFHLGIFHLHSHEGNGKVLEDKCENMCAKPISFHKQAETKQKEGPCLVKKGTL